MKTTQIAVITGTILVSSIVPASADLIAPCLVAKECHMVSFCTQIKNAEAYLDRILVVFANLHGSRAAYKVTDNTRLCSGYKNYVGETIYWAPRTYVDAKGMHALGIADSLQSAVFQHSDNFLLGADTNFHLLDFSMGNPGLDTIGYLAPNSNPISSVEYILDYAHIPKTNVCWPAIDDLNLLRINISFSDGRPDSVVLYPPTQYDCFVEPRPINVQIDLKTRSMAADRLAPQVRNGMFTYSIPLEGPASVGIFNSMGRIVTQKSGYYHKGDLVSIPLNSLAPGCYWESATIGGEKINRQFVVTPGK